MKHLLEEMTFLEFQERMAEDPVIILPLGSVEVQGPNNPMGDFVLAERIAALVAERTGAIAAPCLPFGVADVFRDVPGGMQLLPDSFRAVLRDLIGAFLDHGLERVLVLNGHTGNTAMVDVTVREIRRARGVIVPWLNVWPTAMLANKAAHGENAARSLGHGSDPIGSVYEYFYPALRRSDVPPPPETPKTVLGLPTAGLGGLTLGNVPVGAPVRMLDHCDAVVGGDPTLANAAAGKVFADFVIDTASKLVEHLKTV
jgi:creatinine amidohydrolase